MSKLKTQQEKLLTLELTRKIMEYTMGLSEKNEPKIRKRVEKSSREIVKLYTDAIKRQHKKAKKQSKKNERNEAALQEQENGHEEELTVAAVSVEHESEVHSIAS